MFDKYLLTLKTLDFSEFINQLIGILIDLLIGCVSIYLIKEFLGFLTNNGCNGIQICG